MRVRGKHDDMVNISLCALHLHYDSEVHGFFDFCYHRYRHRQHYGVVCSCLRIGVSLSMAFQEHGYALMISLQVYK
jgi:hypothetical protein